MDATLLLLAMYKQANSSTTAYIEADELGEWADRGDDRLLTLISHLERANLIVRGPAASGLWCQLTAVGVVKAEQVLRDRSRPAARYDAALNGLIAAATDKFPTHRLEVQAFLFTRHARILDQVLELDEIFSAIEFLEEEKLVTVERDGSRPTAITLTSQGRRCGWNDTVNVQGFLAGQQPSGIGQSWYVTVNGGAPQMGQGNVQHNTFGLDVTQVMQIVRELNGLIPTLKLPEQVRERIAEDVEALEREAERDEPQPNRINRLLEAVREGMLTQSGTATATAAATAAAAVARLIG